MTRSEINGIIEKAVKFLERQNFKLPPFAFWGPKDWVQKGNETDEIVKCMLGWDITDFGSADFKKIGLVMFTVRNGHMKNPKYSHKPYCEKILISEEEQITPMHFHWNKVEDIINRAGGNLVIQFYNSTRTEGLSDKDIAVSVDGVCKTIKAGETIVLSPGESVCIPARLYHKFWGEKSRGTVLIVEVSKINDDTIDNRFHEKTGRFPAIEEDVPQQYLLFSEYQKYRRIKGSSAESMGHGQ